MLLIFTCTDAAHQIHGRSVALQLASVFDLALVIDASIDPVQICIGDEGAAVVALSRPVDALTKLRHQVEECVEFDAELYRPRRTGLLKLSLLKGYSSIVTWSTPLPSGAS